MRYGKSVINCLLDSYESSGNFDGDTGRRVFLKKSFRRPAGDAADYETFLSELVELREKGILDFDWLVKGHVVDRIWLVRENVRSAYDMAGRENKHVALENARSAIQNAENSIKDGWIKAYLDKILDDVSQNRLPGLWSADAQLIGDVLKALKLVYALDGGSISMRAASVKLYANSKRFENDIKGPMISIAKRYEPVLAQLGEDEEELSEREILSQLGIVKMSEILEFCGGLKVFYRDGAVDYSPIRHGACIAGDALSEISRVELCGVQSILFIENKTNYTEYCLNSRHPSQLVVLHGGLYSPTKGAFFKLLSAALRKERVLYWGDIDLGGFHMFCRLRENIFPTLLPYNMDGQSFEKYKMAGLSRSESYLAKIEKLREDPRYAVFSDVIERILQSKVTIEQEVFLS